MRKCLDCETQIPDDAPDWKVRCPPCHAAFKKADPKPAPKAEQKLAQKPLTDAEALRLLTRLFVAHTVGQQADAKDIKELAKFSGVIE